MGIFGILRILIPSDFDEIYVCSLGYVVRRASLDYIVLEYLEGAIGDLAILHSALARGKEI